MFGNIIQSNVYEGYTFINSKYIFEKKPFYVVFVDLMTCYDTITHNMLRFKLFKMGV